MVKPHQQNLKDKGKRNPIPVGNEFKKMCDGRSTIVTPHQVTQVKIKLIVKTDHAMTGVGYNNSKLFLLNLYS